MRQKAAFVIPKNTTKHEKKQLFFVKIEKEKKVHFLYILHKKRKEKYEKTSFK